MRTMLRTAAALVAAVLVAAGGRADEVKVSPEGKILEDSGENKPAEKKPADKK